LIVTIVASVAFLDAPAAIPQATVEAKSNTETYHMLDVFAAVFERVRSDYVEEVSDETLVESAINGMLTSLDSHSSYLNAKNYKDMQVQTRGEFGGLGLEVTMENGVIKVVSPIDDAPAAKAGIKPNDLIIQVDGQPVAGLSLPDAVEKMRGPVNSNIKLTILREGRDPFDVTVTRAIVKIQSVKSHLEGDNIAYIRITSFDEQTDSGLQNAVKNLKQQAGNKLVGYVLDLRNNPGGLLDQAIAVCNNFLPKGTEVLSTRGRRDGDLQRYTTTSGDVTGGLPIVVLINGGSASASEIVAGALQDHHRAVLLGTKSFGKGSVQTIIPLPGHGAMRLTTARYYTPSGRSIQAKGIEPDILVEPAKIEKVAQAGIRHEADLRGALKNTDKAAGQAGGDAPANVPPGTTPAAPAEKGDASSVDPLVLGTAEDYQLTRALDMLRGVALFNGRALN
jgi:carboxyl-terminal processing protease